MLKKLVTTLIVSSILFSCKKQDNFRSDLAGSDTIVRIGNNFAFGYYYVFTPQPYAHSFMLQDQKVYPGFTQRLWEPLYFSARPMADSLQQLARDLELSFPASLETNPDSVYGHPNAHDQGYFYIEKMTNNITRWWILDPHVEYMPAHLQPFGQKLQLVINRLQD